MPNKIRCLLMCRDRRMGCSSCRLLVSLYTWQSWENWKWLSLLLAQKVPMGGCCISGGWRGVLDPLPQWSRECSRALSRCLEAPQRAAWASVQKPGSLARGQRHPLFFRLLHKHCSPPWRWLGIVISVINGAIAFVHFCGADERFGFPPALSGTRCLHPDITHIL